MKAHRLTWLAAGSFVMFVACTPQDCPEVEADAAPVEKVDIAAFEQDLEAVQASYVEAFNAADAAGIAALFAADGRLSAPLTPSADVAAIEALYTASFEAGVPVVLEVMREDFKVMGDMAVAWGAFLVTVTPPEGDPFTYGGQYGSIMHLDADGVWKLFRHMYNYEVPPPGFGEGM